MYKNKKILALIPARGGSKRLPGKNVKPFLGKPLIAWTIEQACSSNLVDKIVVSTDDEQIAAISLDFGAEVPFMRPKELASDSASSVDVALHSYEFLHKHGEDFDYLALLEPTSPLRKKDDIDRGIRTLLDHQHADCLVSVGAIHLEHPCMARKLEKGVLVSYLFDRDPQEKAAQQAYFPYGVIYLIKISELYKRRTFFPENSVPLFIERWQNFEIDDKLDFFINEEIMKNYFLNPQNP